MFFIKCTNQVWGHTFKFRMCQNRKSDVLVNKSGFVNGHFSYNIFQKIPNKASRVKQSQLRTKIKITFAT